MNRIDVVVLRRLANRIGITVLGAFGIIALVESLNTWRFDHLASIGGVWLGVTGIAVNAALWTLNTLPVTLLIGAIVGLLDLQARREMTVISASGISVWQVARAPLVAVVLVGTALAVAGDTAIVTLMRSLSLSLPQGDTGGALWLEQQGGGHNYTMVAQLPHAGGTVLEEVTFFLPAELHGPRLRAPRVELRDNAWHVAQGVRFAPDTVPARVVNVEIPTDSSRGDLGAQLASPSQLTLVELLQVGGQSINDPELKSGVEMRLMRLLALPLTLAASLVIAFAFTAGYRRTNKYGAAVLYGIVLGFVVYVVTETAATAGSAGMVQPTLAAFVPAAVAILVGTTVLLFREDGRR
jgi:lipopolysaccharide export system permease protein